MSRYEKAWQATRERIAQAVAARGRNSQQVTLLAVSKTFGADAVRAVHALGQRAFGENYVQEAVAKRGLLADLPDIRWHLIGPLQGNKARLAALHFDVVESVDRIDIAQRLSNARPPDRSPLDVLVQVNVSMEVTKSGVPATGAVTLAHAIAGLPRLRLRGIMGIPSPTADATRLREEFRALRQCFEACRVSGLPVDILSMGMSADLEVAIAEGATEVRVGTAIFGRRE